SVAEQTARRRLRLLPAAGKGGNLSSHVWPQLRQDAIARSREDQTPRREVDTSEGVVVVATPANPFVLKGMKPGDTRSYSQQVSVIELDDPADQEYSGSLHGTYTSLG